MSPASTPRLEERIVARRMVPLPTAIIPFILQNLDGFDVGLEDGDRIVIVPRSGALIHPASRVHLQNALIQKLAGVSAARLPILRPKFTYRAQKHEYTPDQAKAFGMSKPRLQVYRLVWEGGEKGVRYSVIREKSELPHGSVQQILHWLRKQKLVIGTPDIEE